MYGSNTVTGKGGDSGSCIVKVSTETSCLMTSSPLSGVSSTATSFPTFGIVPEQL